MALQTYGIPPNTWDVGAVAVKAHRVLTQEGTNYRKAIGAIVGSTNLVGVSATSRDPGDSVAVRQMGEAGIECAAIIEIGTRVVVADHGADDTLRGRIVTAGTVGAGTTLVGIARSRGGAAGQIVEVDLKQMGMVA